MLAAGGAGTAGLGAAGGGAGGQAAGQAAGGARAPVRGNGATRGTARDRSTARITARLATKGLNVRERDVDAGTDCAAHSYGQVQQFFRAHPCAALFRALLEVRDGRSNVALIAVAWVDMPNPDDAAQLQELMDRPGSGNVTELSREAGRQRFTGRYYRSARDGTTVVNVQAEPVGRARAAVALAQLAVDTTI